MPRAEDVAAQLGRMNRNFAALAERFGEVAAAADQMMQTMSLHMAHVSEKERDLRNRLGRIEGGLAALEDWGEKLWPEDEDDE